jgi:ATP-binding cassette subfamily C protein
MAKALYRDLSNVESEMKYIKKDQPLEHDDRIEFKKKIGLNNISFSYDPSSRFVLQDITITIEKNTTVAFVGQTGCGKTTLIDILLGLYKIKGDIFVDDVKIDNTNLRKWQNRIGYVPQDIFLIDDTITRNIAFGVPDEEIEEVKLVNAVKTANLYDFITEELPSGFDTVVGERGVRLSGGQRQRLGIARALYHEPDVLVLDEATSSLDNETEGLVMKAVHDLMGEKTIIIVAHRMSTVIDADTIYLLEKGKIVAEGTYNALIEQSDRFKTLANIVYK